MDIRPLRYLGCFSGIGGLELAVEHAAPGSRPIALIEREAYSVAVLVARMADGSLSPCPIWSDIATFRGDVLRAVVDRGGPVDLVAGGFPCQDLSTAGKRGGIHANRSALFFDILRIANDVGARYLFLENVAGIYVRPNLDVVLGALAESGWDAEWFSLRASDVGASHQRERWFCLARRSGLDLADPGRRPVGIDDGNGWGTETTAGTGSAAVADGACGGRGEQRSASDEGRGGHADRSNGDVADAGRPERRRAEESLGSGAGCAASGRAGGQASPATESLGQRDALADPGNRQLPQPGRGPSGRDGAGSADADDVGDADSERRRVGSHIPEQRRYETRPSGKQLGSVPFPPGPADRDAWAAILAERPDFAPALIAPLRGVAPRFSAELDLAMRHRTDRLRALGNAVVPLQAATAFRELWRRLEGDGVT